MEGVQVGDGLLREIAREMVRWSTKSRRGHRAVQTLADEDVTAAEYDLKKYACAAREVYVGHNKYAGAGRAPEKWSLINFRKALSYKNQGNGRAVATIARDCVSQAGCLNRVGVAQLCLEAPDQLPPVVTGPLKGAMRLWAKEVMLHAREPAPSVIPCTYNLGLVVKQTVYKGQVVAAYFGGLCEQRPPEAETHTISTQGVVRVWTNGNNRWLTGVPGYLAAHAANTALTTAKANVRHDRLRGVCVLVATRDLYSGEAVLIPPTRGKKEFEGAVSRVELQRMIREDTRETKRAILLVALRLRSTKRLPDLNTLWMLVVDFVWSPAPALVHTDRPGEAHQHQSGNQLDSRQSMLGCEGLFVTRAKARDLAQNADPYRQVWKIPVDHGSMISIKDATPTLRDAIEERWPHVASYWTEVAYHGHTWLCFPHDCYGRHCPLMFKSNAANTRACRVGGGVRAEITYLADDCGVTHICYDVNTRDCAAALEGQPKATHFEVFNVSYAFTGTARGRPASNDGAVLKLDRLQELGAPVRMLPARDGHASQHTMPNSIVYKVDEADVDVWRPIDWRAERVRAKLDDQRLPAHTFIVVGDDAAIAAYDTGGGGRRGVRTCGARVYALQDGQLKEVCPDWPGLVEPPRSLLAYHTVPAAPFGVWCWTGHALPPQCFQAVCESLQTSPATVSLLPRLLPWWPGTAEPGPGAGTYVFVVASGQGGAPRLAVRNTPEDPVLGDADKEVAGAPPVRGGAVLMRLWHP